MHSRISNASPDIRFSIARAILPCAAAEPIEAVRESAVARIVRCALALSIHACICSASMTNLERLRRELDLDQKALAQRAGVAQSTVSRAESGGKLTADTALALARALGVTVEMLLGDGPSTLAATGT